MPRTIEQLLVDLEDGARTSITVSPGGALSQSAEVSGRVSGDAPLAAADRALYRAQAECRNRAVLAEPRAAQPPNRKMPPSRSVT